MPGSVVTLRLASSYSGTQLQSLSLIRPYVVIKKYMDLSLTLCGYASHATGLKV
jgi:hypothetical protein